MADDVVQQVEGIDPVIISNNKGDVIIHSTTADGNRNFYKPLADGGFKRLETVSVDTDNPDPAEATRATITLSDKSVLNMGQNQPPLLNDAAVSITPYEGPQSLQPAALAAAPEVATAAPVVEAPAAPERTIANAERSIGNVERSIANAEPNHEEILREVGYGKLLGDKPDAASIESALRAFQQANGLEATGKPNEETNKLMAEKQDQFKSTVEAAAPAVAAPETPSSNNNGLVGTNPTLLENGKGDSYVVTSLPDGSFAFFKADGKGGFNHIESELQGETDASVATITLADGSKIDMGNGNQQPTLNGSPMTGKPYEASAAPAAAASIAESLSGAYDAAKGAVGTGWQRLDEGLGIGTPTGQFNQIGRDTQGVLQNVGNALQSGFSSLKELGTGLANRAGDGLSALGDSLSQLGKEEPAQPAVAEEKIKHRPPSQGMGGM